MMDLRAWARVSSEFFCIPKACSPFRIPCRFSCSLLFRRQAVDRPVNGSCGSSSFGLLALTALLIAFCSRTKAWGRSCHRTQEGEDEGPDFRHLAEYHLLFTNHFQRIGAVLHGQHHLKAANTFHAARARSWTWQQHRQEKWLRHRLDYFVVPMAAQ